MLANAELTDADLEKMKSAATRNPGFHWSADRLRLVSEVRRLRKAAESAIAIADTLSAEADDGLAWQQRPKGGQQVGHSASSFCNTSPSGIVAVKRSMRWIRKALNAKQTIARDGGE